jgi:aspartate-semialdehyde dehydrogenase
MALKPIEERFGIEQIFVTTMQAVSGAGYPGVPSMDILDNVVPYIGSEEEKMESRDAQAAGPAGGPCRDAARARMRRTATACRWWTATRSACPSSSATSWAGSDAR